jgi:hypothetical protein
MSFPPRAGRISRPVKRADDERDEEHMAMPSRGAVPIDGTVSARPRGGRRRTVAGHGGGARVRRR